MTHFFASSHIFVLIVQFEICAKYLTYYAIEIWYPAREFSMKWTTDGSTNNMLANHIPLSLYL